MEGSWGLTNIILNTSKLSGQITIHRLQALSNQTDFSLRLRQNAFDVVKHSDGRRPADDLQSARAQGAACVRHIIRQVLQLVFVLEKFIVILAQIGTGGIQR